MNTLLSLLCFLSLVLPVKELYVGKEYTCDINELDETSNKGFLSNANSSASYKLNIFEDKGKYEIYHSCFLSIEMMCSSLVSYGSFSEKNDSVILTDDLFGYKMYFKKSKNKLTSITTMVYLENKTFIYRYDDFVNYKWHYYDINQIKHNNNKKYVAVNNFSSGVYYGNFEINHYLDIDSVGTYCYYMEKIPVSQGKWEQKGSELLLKDSSVDVTFSLLITTEGLVSQLLPGDLYGILLKKIR